MRLPSFSTIAAVTVLSLLSQPAHMAGATATDCPVTVSVLNVQSAGGFILAALYDEAGWGEKPVATTRTAVANLSPTVCLRPPGAGRYAVRLFHDINGDGRLQSNMLGLPTEPYGFSNDARLQFGPPSFAAAAFDLKDSAVTQSITLR